MRSVRIAACVLAAMGSGPALAQSDPGGVAMGPLMCAYPSGYAPPVRAARPRPPARATACHDPLPDLDRRYRAALARLRRAGSRRQGADRFRRARDDGGTEQPRSMSRSSAGSIGSIRSMRGAIIWRRRRTARRPKSIRCATRRIGSRRAWRRRPGAGRRSSSSAMPHEQNPRGGDDDRRDDHPHRRAEPAIGRGRDEYRGMGDGRRRRKLPGWSRRPIARPAGAWPRGGAGCPSSARALDPRGSMSSRPPLPVPPEPRRRVPASPGARSRTSSCAVETATWPDRDRRPRGRCAQPADRRAGGDNRGTHLRVNALKQQGDAMESEIWTLKSAASAAEDKRDRSDPERADHRPRHGAHRGRDLGVVARRATMVAIPGSAAAGKGERHAGDGRQPDQPAGRPDVPRRAVP